MRWRGGCVAKEAVASGHYFGFGFALTPAGIGVPRAADVPERAERLLSRSLAFWGRSGRCGLCFCSKSVNAASILSWHAGLAGRLGDLVKLPIGQGLKSENIRRARRLTIEVMIQL